MVQTTAVDVSTCVHVLCVYAWFHHSLEDPAVNAGLPLELWARSESLSLCVPGWILKPDMANAHV